MLMMMMMMMKGSHAQFAKKRQLLGACGLGWIMQCDLFFLACDICIICHASTATSNCLQYTHPKTNMEPENHPFEKDNQLTN